MAWTAWLSAFLFVLPLTKGFSTKKETSPNLRDDVETTRNVFFEIAGSKVNSISTNKVYASRITIHIQLKNITYSIDLILNTHLLAPSYVEKIITKNGTMVRRTNISEEFCYYIGKVRNTKQSNAAFSACRGIRGFFVISDTTFNVTPFDPDNSLAEGMYEVRKVRNDDLSQRVHGTDDIEKELNGMFDNRRVKRQIVPGSMYGKLVIELYVANDKSRLDNFKGDIDKVIKSTKETANVANLLYQPVGYFVILVGLEVWQDNDQIDVSNDSAIALRNWKKYRFNNVLSQHYNDVGFLITQRFFNNYVLGFSIVSSMCSSKNSAGVMTAIFDQSHVSGNILAHEIGHTLGLSHDTRGCTCESSNGICIMSANNPISKPPPNFSTCSIVQLTEAVDRGFGICLKNTQFDESQFYSVCGNGFLEEGEECDCGNMPEQECNKTCCDDTCNLVGSSLCASGGCCDLDTCQPKRLATECRSVVGSCDLPEVCDGVSPFCPKDVFKHNGLYCSVDGVYAYCWEGHCSTHRTQCQELYGPTARESEDICYTTYNVGGDANGNCGFKLGDDITYFQCEPGNVKCGTLHCDAPNNTLVRYTNYLFKIDKSANNAPCFGAILDYGTKVENPGMVPNGVSCEPGLMCLSQECVDVSVALYDKPCPRCSYGVCNNEGECHCDAGYTGIYCDRRSDSNWSWNRRIVILEILIIVIKTNLSMLF